MAEIRLENVRKDFGSFTAVETSTFTVDDGEFFMLLGPSGCGKTTTLRMIAGLELPSSGSIYIDNDEVAGKPASQRDIAFVFQMFALYPHMNVRKNIAYPLRSQGVSRSETAKRVQEVASILGIEGILNRPVSGLSGGDRQRVALGRAIVRRPKAFLMDEPLGALDAEFRERMAEELRALHERLDATTVYVTHDQLEAMQMGDRIVVMNHGVVEQYGRPQEIYDWPATRFVADFIGSPSMNFLEFDGAVEAGATSVSLGRQTFVMPELREGARGTLVLGVRPEHLRLTDSASYRGQVVSTEYLGADQIVTVDVPHGTLKVRMSSATTVGTGESVGVELAPHSLTLFAGEQGRALRSAGNEMVIQHG